ncbi:MAG TPA: hypothetical protein DCW90_09170 [Lachnospiraceae bacterium]|nr:hypothetical protein [Lachnospiraceae bacterium]
MQATCLEETTVNNNSDSQNGSEVASEVQEPAQVNQASQEQGDSDSNQSSNMTPEQTPSNLQPTIINGKTDASQLDWSNSFGPLEHAESGEGIHAY